MGMGLFRSRGSLDPTLLKLQTLSSILALVLTSAWVLIGAAYLPAAWQQPQGPAGEAPTWRALLDRYCVTCHNERLRTAGLTLDGISVETVSPNTELWEKVVRKLRARAMPPAGLPRPEGSTLTSFAAYLESELDRAAAAKPDPGRPTVHRLNRAEYANAIRDLLALEVDGESLLPPDNAGYGFDNIADVLSVSPLLMEKYMLAAGKISRLALGAGSMRPTDEKYLVADGFTQEGRASEDLPFGSRGGIAIRHRFPVDGEYVIQIRLQRNYDGYIRGIGRPHQLDVRLDGDRVKLLSIGGERKARSGPIFTASQNPDYAGDPDQVVYEFTADEALEARFPAQAGTRLVGVAFLKETRKPQGILTPPLTLSELGHYKGGDPAVESVTIIGPYNAKGRGETPSRQKVLVCRPSSGSDEEVCASKILATLARRAYRRPVTEEEVQELLSVYRAGREEGDFEAGLETALQSILAGPEFLFRVESDPANVAPGAAYRISDLELASRLSFFLWSSIPDDELLESAERGQLKDPAVLERQVRRMLVDPRSKALVNNFAGQWLYLRNLRTASPDPRLFAEFDDELRSAFRQETELLFESMLREDRGVVELLSADYTFVNERLARHYGIPNIYGSRLRRVSVTAEERKGLLGQGSILTVTSYANRTSPVLRGKWVLENLLGTPPPPPPPDVPPLEEKSKDGEPLTMRQMMEQHRANAVCASCHKLMDPIGFALENFDAVGKFRTTYADTKSTVDASGVLYDGSKFQGVAELRQILLSHPEQFSRTLTEKLMTYALGREVEYYDAPAVRRILREAGPDYRWSSIIIGIVKSTPFQMRRSRES
jgi:mono/diheme cytochrome c family protein